MNNVVIIWKKWLSSEKKIAHGENEHSTSVSETISKLYQTMDSTHQSIVHG